MKRFSIIQPELNECLACRLLYNVRTPFGLHKHEVFFGTDNRKKSIKYGMVVALCGSHHNMSNEGVHCGNKQLDLKLKQLGQRVFEKEYSHEKFMEVFHRNYL